MVEIDFYVLAALVSGLEIYYNTSNPFMLKAVMQWNHILYTLFQTVFLLT